MLVSGKHAHHKMKIRKASDHLLAKMKADQNEAYFLTPSDEREAPHCQDRQLLEMIPPNS